MVAAKVMETPNTTCHLKERGYIITRVIANYFLRKI